MNYLLIALIATGALLLGPVLMNGDPWDDDDKGKGRQTAYDSGDYHPWEDKGQGSQSAHN